MSKQSERRGLMLVLSSPSGAGKTTLANLLMDSDPHAKPSISYTTRAKRPGEIEGKHYYFVDKKTFQQMIADNKFLEYAEVFGNFYGTPKEEVEDILSKGDDVVFDIDWQGNKSLTENSPTDVVSVFILPPSKKILRERLIKRAQDASETIELRMAKANSELSHWQDYDYVIVNKDINVSLNKLKNILSTERLRKHRRLGLHEAVKNLINETEE